MNINKADTLIVTPTLGNRSTLIRTVDSIKKIGGDRVKHVLITPADRIEKLKVQFPELEIISEPLDCIGIYQALNFAILKLAKDYKYLSYLNDDDFWLPNFKYIFQEMDKHSEIDIVYGRVKFIDDQAKVIGEQASTGQYKAFGNLLKYNVVLFTQQATLIRSNVFYEIGGFDNSYKLIADTKFWLNAVNHKKKFKYINVVCAAYMFQKHQLSSDNSLQMKEHKRLLHDIPKTNFVNTFIDLLLYRCFNVRIYLTRILHWREFKKKLYVHS